MNQECHTLDQEPDCPTDRLREEDSEDLRHCLDTTQRKTVEEKVDALAPKDKELSKDQLKKKVWNHPDRRLLRPLGERKDCHHCGERLAKLCSQNMAEQ
ncbi:unnamed protein product [Sympodiomycopsis kandeliae]